MITDCTKDVAPCHVTPRHVISLALPGNALTVLGQTGPREAPPCNTLTTPGQTGPGCELTLWLNRNRSSHRTLTVGSPNPVRDWSPTRVVVLHNPYPARRPHTLTGSHPVSSSRHHAMICLDYSVMSHSNPGIGWPKMPLQEQEHAVFFPRPQA